MTSISLSSVNRLAHTQLVWIWPWAIKLDTGYWCFVLDLTSVLFEIGGGARRKLSPENICCLGWALLPFKDTQLWDYLQNLLLPYTKNIYLIFLAPLEVAWLSDYIDCNNGQQKLLNYIHPEDQNTLLSYIFLLRMGKYHTALFWIVKTST